MGDSHDGAMKLASACAALFLAAAACASPAYAVSEMEGPGETAVFVAMEYDEAIEAPTVRFGNIESEVDVAPSPTRTVDALPRTGDGKGACALVAALFGVAGALSMARCMAGWLSSPDGRKR